MSDDERFEDDEEEDDDAPPGASTVRSPRPPYSEAPPLGARAAGRSDTSGTPSSRATAFHGSSVVLLAGPTGVGKTRWLMGVDHACASNPTTPPWLELSFDSEMAELIADGYALDSQRKGIIGTEGVKRYTFTVDASTGDGDTRRRIGVKTFACLDGQGGALFYSDLKNRLDVAGDPAIRAYRTQLLETGRAASSIVFFVNPLRRDELVGNMPLILSQLTRPIQVAVQPESSEEGIFSFVRRKLRREEPEPAREPEMATAMKIGADRILFLFNWVDQIAVDWQRTWVKHGNPKGQRTALQIAKEDMRPVDFAQRLLGRRFLQQVRGFMREDAQLAVGLCSAGGFTSHGDPYRNEMGTTDVMEGVNPRIAEEHRQLFGVREAVMFAGFGIQTPNVVEVLSYSMLALTDGAEQGAADGRR